MVQKSAYTDTEAHADECVLASSGPYNKANIFLGLIEYELNNLRGAKHVVGYISVHIRFNLERYLPNIGQLRDNMVYRGFKQPMRQL